MIVWRLLTAPLATNYLFDVILFLPIFVAKCLYPKEHLKGTATSILEFFTTSNCLIIYFSLGVFYVLLFSAFAIIFGPRDTYYCGVFPLLVA